jgi:hypothetical protein
MRWSDEEPAPIWTAEPWDGPRVMMLGSIASGDGSTFSILSQSIPAPSVSEDDEDLEGEEDEVEVEGDDEGPASGCAARPGIEGILYFGVPRVGVGPTWSFKGLGGFRRRSQLKGMMFVQGMEDGVGASSGKRKEWVIRRSFPAKRSEWCQGKGQPGVTRPGSCSV